jgi:hypothetical protein
VAGGKSKNLFSRSDSVVPGLSKKQMALAMEWMMASDVGLELIEHAQEALGDSVEPCRTVTQVLQRAIGADGVKGRMAETLLGWCKERMPIPSFLHYVQARSRESNEAGPQVAAIHRRSSGGISASMPPMVPTPVERVTRGIVTYNVNSIMAAIGREDGKLLEFVESSKADVIAL